MSLAKAFDNAARELPLEAQQLTRLRYAPQAAVTHARAN
jgi:hypothetical protein